MDQQTPVPLALAQLAAASPDSPAVTDDAGTLTRADVECHANRMAHVFARHGVREGDVVTLALPSDRWFLVAAVAVWKLGATPQPVPPAMPAAELQGVVNVTRPALVVGAAVHGFPGLRDLPVLASTASAPLPIRISPSWKAPVSGGSTGQPKVIVSTTPAVVEPLALLAQAMRVSGRDVVLATAPLHHNAPFLFASTSLFLGAHVVLAGRFEPERTLALVQQHRATWAYLVPTMMSRISKLPSPIRSKYDVSSLHTVFHMAAPCPHWVKRDWIDWLGPDCVWELYAGTEAQAVTVIGGTEWLQRPGSVGRSLVGEITVLDEHGMPVTAGTVGEVWMRATSGPTYRYLGASARTREGGWESLGDLGYFDEDGYLYLCDRLSDMVLVGGVNVYPAEIEAVLDEHPSVLSSAVVGLPDADLGNRLHAIVQVAGSVTDADLLAWCAARLSRHKLPRTVERVEQPLRDEAAKVRRSALRAERLPAPSA